MTNGEVEKKIRAALEHDKRINLHHDPIGIDYDGEVVTLSGEVADIAAKRLALEHAAVLPEVSAVVDRLHVRPGERMGDGAIAVHIERSLLEDTSFGGFTLRTRVGAKHGPKAEPAAFSSIPPALPNERRDVNEAGDGSERGDANGPGDGGERGDATKRRATAGQSAARTEGDGESDLPRPPWIEISVDDGVVTLDGDVPSLSHKRLAGVLAWWAPGSRDVINGLGVEPSDEDTDEEILDALRIVLDKDPVVDATQISATCKNGIVTLEGLVENEAHRDLVEFDAWALFGVDKVVNRIQVR